MTQFSIAAICGSPISVAHFLWIAKCIIKRLRSLAKATGLSVPHTRWSPLEDAVDDAGLEDRHPAQEREPAKLAVELLEGSRPALDANRVVLRAHEVAP